METNDIFKAIFFFGIIFVLFLIAYEDGSPFALFKRFRCKIGWHKRRLKFGSMRIRKYYCQWCGKSRKHPSLKSIDGGKKEWDNIFKF